MQTYEVGDIVLVSDIKEPKERANEVTYHPFIIIDEDHSVVSMDLYGFLISSNTDKNKDVSKYKYNEPIKKSKENNLSKNGHVKCDTLYTFDKNYIIMKIGSVSVEDFLRFLTAFETYQKEIEQ